ncbi:immune system released activating agent [Mus musculus]|jgi:hypothetical protein|uniref:Immune system released activating agent n=1 Tax=Mus musculus TaxID=10090 RepID=B2CXA1_MOUSE|nr:immune system released activating agent [Mus musculus]ACB55610.1 immune system released activating agent [Mus musculus]|eukprot:NP_001296359.1 immune system released activating agent [Mus musculus]
MAGETVLQGCPLCPDHAEGDRSPRIGGSQRQSPLLEVTHTQCCHLILSCLYVWCPVTQSLYGAPEQHSFLSPLVLLHASQRPGTHPLAISLLTLPSQLVPEYTEVTSLQVIRILVNPSESANCLG